MALELNAAAWLARNRLVLATGVAAAIPVIVSTINAVANGWLPLGDDAITAVRSYDVLSAHPPVLGPISTSSLLIGHPVLSPGPMLFWLLALPVRLGRVSPAVAMGVVNTACVVGVVALARRRGGRAMMFATAAAVAAMCGSLDSYVWHDLWGPAATLLPFTLLLFLAWSVGCGEYRLLPLTALVASFTIQSHLTYILPGAAILAVGIGFLALSRPAIPRGWLWATLAVVIVCWAAPVAEEAVHRPGNFERIAQAATAVKQSYGPSGGFHVIVHSVGIPPSWLEPPRTPFGRLAEVVQTPTAFEIATALLILASLAGVALLAIRSNLRGVAVAAVLSLAALASLFAVTASSPSKGPLLVAIAYTIWWASPAGMFAWLVLGFGAATMLFRAGRLDDVRARALTRLGRVAVLPSAVAVVAVCAVGIIVAAGENRNRLEPLFAPARDIAGQAVANTPPQGTVFINGDNQEIGVDLQSAVAYEMRRSGRRFVVSSLPGIGTHYAPSKNPHTLVLTVTEHPRAGSHVIVRKTLVNVPSDAPPNRRTFFVTLAPG